MNNRLYCTFVLPEEIEDTVNDLKESYTILFKKIFVLISEDQNKTMLTYNIDMNNTSGEFKVPNTILVHRKKQTNTLYTINALNELIRFLNNGFLDKTYMVNWNNYRNCILLYQSNKVEKINTKVKEIINLS